MGAGQRAGRARQADRTYLPLLLLAGDKSYMGQYANGVVGKTLGWLYFGIIALAAVAALPLFLITSGGQG
jgi:Mn2+/Fe2+ NRAMP family transporter